METGLYLIINVNAQLKIAGNSNHDFCFQGKPITIFNDITWAHQAENEGVEISMVTNGKAFCNDSKGYFKWSGYGKGTLENRLKQFKNL